MVLISAGKSVFKLKTFDQKLILQRSLLPDKVGVMPPVSQLPAGNHGHGTLPVKMLAAGVAGCIADCATFPLDTAKVRLQVQGEKQLLTSKGGGELVRRQYRGMLQTISAIVREEGTRGLYKGLNAGLQRQLCFVSVRVGLYDSVKSLYQRFLYGSEVPDDMQVLTRISAGVTTGGVAVLLAQPTDVVKVRFQAQKTGVPVRYKSTLEAYSSILKNEGVKGLWKGMIPNIGRNAIVNVSEIVCYDIIKDSILRRNLMKDNVPCHFVSAIIAGFCTTLVASPVDVVKTRYMNSRAGEYKGAIDCTVRTFIQEGSKAFYKGFTPSFYRLVSWNIVMWLTYEQLKRLWSIG